MDPSQGTWICPICRECFDDRGEFIDHLASSHFSEYTCQICMTTVTVDRHTPGRIRDRLRSHSQRHAPRVFCRYCGREYQQEASRARHERINHREISEASDGLSSNEPSTSVTSSPPDNSHSNDEIEYPCFVEMHESLVAHLDNDPMSRAIDQFISGAQSIGNSAERSSHSYDEQSSESSDDSSLESSNEESLRSSGDGSSDDDTFDGDQGGIFEGRETDLQDDSIEGGPMIMESKRKVSLDNESTLEKTPDSSSSSSTARTDESSPTASETKDPENERDKHDSSEEDINAIVHGVSKL